MVWRAGSVYLMRRGKKKSGCHEKRGLKRLSISFNPRYSQNPRMIIKSAYGQIMYECPFISSTGSSMSPFPEFPTSCARLSQAYCSSGSFLRRPEPRSNVCG